MLALQAGMNRRVDPHWVKARYPYLRAVVLEGAEAMEHHGWKWWKEQQEDLPQLQMELVDIWHFILSELLLLNDGDEARTLTELMPDLRELPCSEPEWAALEIEFDGEAVRPHRLPLLEKLELLIGLAARRRLELAVFAAIMGDCGLDWNGLYRNYVGKNMLNLFRQEMGYKEGGYRKIWGGREDNECLVEILEGLDPEREDFQEAVYAALEAAY